MAVFKRPAPPRPTTSSPIASSPAALRPPVRPAPPQIQQSVTGRMAVETPAAVPVTRPKVLPKEVNNDETAKQSVEEARQDRDGAPAEGHTSFSEEKNQELRTSEGQVTLAKLHVMDLAERHKLWRRMNEVLDSTAFAHLLRREEIPRRAQRKEPNSNRSAYRNAMWCCYCADWTVYEYFGYIGSYKCIGCGMSTKDYYNRAANDLWKSDRY